MLVISSFLRLIVAAELDPVGRLHARATSHPTRSRRGSALRVEACHRWPVKSTQVPNLSAARAFALAASSSRFFGGAFVSIERRRRVEIPAISSTAAMNKPSFAFDGLLKPLIFLTNWSEAARTSSSVTGGSKLKRGLIFLHITMTSRYGTANAQSYARV